jgi:membrane glycosyltransferase
MDLSEATRLIDRDAALMPPVQRSCMAPRAWGMPWRGMAESRGARGDALRPVALRRRNLLVALVIATTAAAALSVAQLHAGGALTPGVVVQEALFTLLFGWICAWFYTGLTGFIVLMRGDPHALTAASVRGAARDAGARTAVVMPICNEEVAVVFANLRASAESLARTGESGAFDFFVLSDTPDPAVRAQEREAARRLRAPLSGEVRVFYRWRRVRQRKKAGNIADFCRRWGRAYRYMIVLDADSVMTGEAMTTLARLMDAHPDAGIIQTLPRTWGHDTLHARAQQFAGRVSGRLLAAGMRYFQLGESHYWGHNAILRVEPFTRHCALARIPGSGPLDGEILSHDFMEAALMRRAGYRIWLADDLPGSYEQLPPDLTEELVRDRRWCRGNLQNVQLFAEPGLHSAHRALLLVAAAAYVAAPVWLAFVVLGSALWTLSGDPGIPAPYAMDGRAQTLWAAIIAMLVLPRLLGAALIVVRREQAAYGGVRALAGGVALEFALSTLQAPVRMVAHSVFVLSAITGARLEWKSPPREARALAWRESLRTYGPLASLVLGVWLTLAFCGSPSALWLAPIALPLLAAAPLAVATSDPRLGKWLRARGVLLVPEESAAPAELRMARALAVIDARG